MTSESLALFIRLSYLPNILPYIDLVTFFQSKIGLPNLNSFPLKLLLKDPYCE